jgi:hypothetical protein
MAIMLYCGGEVLGARAGAFEHRCHIKVLDVEQKIAAHCVVCVCVRARLCVCLYVCLCVCVSE